MTFELVIRPEAEADALEAFRWYNEQVHGLGQEFLTEIDMPSKRYSRTRRRTERSIANIVAVSCADFRIRSSTRCKVGAWSFSEYSTQLEIPAFGEGEARMPSNKSLERTVNRGGRTVRACMFARTGAEKQQWPAVQRNR